MFTDTPHALNPAALFDRGSVAVKKEDSDVSD